MKRALITVLVVLFMASTPCFANEARIEELQAEAQELLGRKQQYQQIVNNIDVRIIEIQGIIKEYNLDKVEEKE